MGQKSQGDSKPQGFDSLEIPCAVDGGCAEMKTELEELVSAMRSLHN